MDRQTYQTTNFGKNTQYINTRNQGFNKNVNPIKELSTDVITSIFSEITFGNYLKIKTFLLENKLTLAIRNTKGETVIHTILMNSNITPKEKLQLVEYAIQQGAPLDLSDENNVTPLHLACKFGLKDVIELLLDKGANINSRDNQAKTPLHYAVSGELTQCKSESDLKVKPLIPKTNIKINNMESDDDMINLQNSIKDYLVNNQETSKFIFHLKNTFDNIEKLYPIEIANFIDGTKNTLLEVFIDKSIKGDKSQFLFEKLMFEKKKLSDFIDNKIIDGVSSLTIKPSQYEGWGPDSLEEHRILEFKELNVMLEKLQIAFKGDLNAITNTKNELLENLGNHINNMKIVSNNIKTVLNDSHYYLHAILSHNDYYLTNGTYEIPNYDSHKFDQFIDLLFTANPSEPFDSPIIDKPGKILLYSNATNLPSSEIDDDLPSARVLIVSNNGVETPLYDIRQLKLQKTDDRPRILKTQMRGNNIDQSPLTSEQPLLFGRNFDLTKLGNPMENDSCGFLRGDTTLNHAETIGLFYNTKFKIYVSILNMLVSELLTNLNVIETDFLQDKLQNVLSLIHKSLSKVFSMITTIGKIHKEIPILNLHTTQLKLFFEEISTSVNANYKWLPEQILDDIYQTENVISKINDITTNSYITVTKFIGVFNKYLILIQKKSLIFSLQTFYCMENFNDFYNNYHTPNLVGEILVNPIQSISSLPVNLNEFLKLDDDNVCKMNFSILSKFAPQITSKNLMCFYKNNIANDKLPKLGYIDFDSYNTGMTPLRSVTYRKLEGSVSVVVSEPLQIKEQKREIDYTEIIFKNPDASLLGSIGELKKDKFSKENAIVPIVGLDLNKHLEMLRYSVVRHVIEVIYKNINSTGVLSDLDSKLKNFSLKIHNKINSIISVDSKNYSFLLVLVGKYVDELLINIIKQMASISVNKLIMGIIKPINQIPKNYLDIILPKLVIQQKDNGFFVNINDVFSDILKFYNTRNIKKFTSITSGNLNDDPEQELNVIKLINFNYEINSLEQSCFKIDQNIVKLLLTKGANINQKDILGNSPIYYAIEMQHKDVIDILINGSVVYNKSYNNISGSSILEQTWKNYDQIVSTLMVNKYKVCDTLTKNIVSKFSKQGDHKNNIPKYSSILLPMTLYLLNHQLYLIGKGYPNNWSFEKQDKLENILNIQTNGVLPLLDDIYLDENDTSLMEIPNMEINEHINDVRKNNEYAIQLNNKKENLTKERKSLSSSTFNHDILRINEIDSDLIKIQNELKKLENIATDNSIEFAKLHKTKKSIVKKNKLENFIEKSKHKIIRSTDTVVDTYESVFINVINNGKYYTSLTKNYYFNIDTKTYPIIWKKFITETTNALNQCKCNSHSSNCIHDYTQILDSLFCHQQSILHTNDSFQNKLNQIQIVSEYYKNIISPFANDFFNLPREYGTINYALKHIIDIIIHIIKRIICVNIVGTITKGLVNYIINTFPYSANNDMYNTRDEYENYILDVVVNIIDDKDTKSLTSAKFTGSKLLKYIYEVIPIKVTKVILQIFDGPDSEFDPDNSLSMPQIFEHIITIIESSTVVKFDPNNSFSSGLKQYVFPYYTDYLELFVKEMFNIMSNYLRSLQYQSKSLIILEQVTMKAVNEMKNEKHIK